MSQSFGSGVETETLTVSLPTLRDTWLFVVTFDVSAHSMSNPDPVEGFSLGAIGYKQQEAISSWWKKTHRHWHDRVTQRGGRQCSWAAEAPLGIPCELFCFGLTSLCSWVHFCDKRKTSIGTDSSRLVSSYFSAS